MSKNPFLDLGVPPEEAVALHIRSQLVTRLELHIRSRSRQSARSFLIKLMIRAGLSVGISGGRKSSEPLRIWTSFRRSSVGRGVTDVSRSEVRETGRASI